LLLSVFGAGGVVLTAVGLYAVLAYVVRLRGREMAIRHALGASPALLRALILRQGLLMAGAGVALGVPMALAGGRLLGSLLFEVRALAIHRRSVW
jgi:putative ABC transport system permease protein